MNWKIGDEIIAIINHSQGHFKIGDKFIIDGFTCCEGCGEPCVYLKGRNRQSISNCVSCNNQTKKQINYASSCFQKPISLSSCIEYKLKVSIPELVELKELQNQ